MKHFMKTVDLKMQLHWQQIKQNQPHEQIAISFITTNCVQTQLYIDMVNEAFMDEQQ